MTHPLLRPVLKVAQRADGRWHVVREQYGRSGRILTGGFDSKPEAIAARNKIRKAMYIR